MKAWWKEFDQAIFSYGSPVTLGVFRLIFGFLIFVNLCMIGVFFSDWFTETGYVPLELAKIWNGNDMFTSVFWGVTDPRVSLAIYVVTALAALFTSLGLFTRVSSILLAVGLVSIHHRNPIILHGGDTLMRVTAIYLAVSPCGAAVSLDRLRRLRKNPGEPLPMISLWPQRLLQFQWALMYFTTAWAKAYGNLWRDGTATWYPPRLTEFTRFPVPDFIDRAPFMQVLTYGTLIVELALATLIFSKPYRKWVVLGGVLLHLGIEYRLNIPLFAFLCITGYINFYSGEEVAAAWDRIRARFRRVAPAAQKPEAAA